MERLAQSYAVNGEMFMVLPPSFDMLVLRPII